MSLESIQRTRQLRKDLGVCITCAQPVNGPQVRCRTCRDDHRRYQVERKRSGGKTCACGRPISNTAARCRMCNCARVGRLGAGQIRKPRAA